MPKDYTKTEQGETVAYWRNQLERSLRSWQVMEGVREELRRITSEYDYGELLVLPGADDSPIIDQRDYHILPRAADRLRDLAGDEMPEIRFSRSMTGLEPKTGQEVTLSSVGEIHDRLVTAAMSSAGAPGANEDGVGAVCVDGIAAYWYEWTGLPSREEVAQSRMSAGDIVQASQSGDYKPGRLQNHEELAEALLKGAVADKEGLAAQVAMTSPGEAPFEAVLAAGGAHLDAAEAESKGTHLYWRGAKFALKCTRYPAGTWFRMDVTGVTDPSMVRWMARKIQMPVDEIAAFGGFRPSVRKKVVSRPFEDPTMVPLMAEDVGGDSGLSDLANGTGVLWHIIDRKFKREYIIAEEGVEEFLVDRPYPWVDRDGRETLRPAGSYTGFFPVSVCRVKLPTRNTSQKLWGIPALLPGLKGAKNVIKLLSYLSHIIKQAAAGYTILDEEVFTEHEEMLRQGLGGFLKRGAGANKSERPIAESFSFKPPSHELLSLINEEVFRTLNDLNFPIADFTSRPIAKTASQEGMAQESGAAGAFSIVRRMEMSYAEQSWIVFSMILADAPDDLIDEWIGPVDRVKLRRIWEMVGIPNVLPSVTYSPKARSQDNMGRAKMLMDLHERAKAEIDPLTLMQVYRTPYLIQEAAKTLNAGPLELYQLTEDEKVALMRAKMEMAADEQMEGDSKQPGQPASNGKTRDSEGKPRGRREAAGRTDSPRGRSRGASTRGRDSGQARDVGPTRV